MWMWRQCVQSIAIWINYRCQRYTRTKSIYNDVYIQICACVCVYGVDMIYSKILEYSSPSPVPFHCHYLSISTTIIIISILLIIGASNFCHHPNHSIATASTTKKSTTAIINKNSIHFLLIYNAWIFGFVLFCYFFLLSLLYFSVNLLLCRIYVFQLP